MFNINTTFTFFSKYILLLFVDVGLSFYTIYMVLLTHDLYESVFFMQEVSVSLVSIHFMLG